MFFLLLLACLQLPQHAVGMPAVSSASGAGGSGGDGVCNLFGDVSLSMFCHVVDFKV